MLGQCATNSPSPMTRGNGEMLEVSTTPVRSAEYRANDVPGVNCDEAETMMLGEIRGERRARVDVAQCDSLD